MRSGSTFIGTDAGTEQLITALRAGGFDVGPPTTVATTVLDTFDGRVHRAGLRLTRRNAVLVLAGREVVTVEVASPAVPRVATDLPPGPFRARLAEVLDVRALLVLATFTSREHPIVRRNSDGKVVASASLVERVEAPPGPLGEWFVVVDDVTGYDRRSSDLGALVVAAGARPLDDDDGTIADIVLRAAGVDPAGHHDDPSVPLDADEPALDGFRLVLANLAASIVANVAGTIDDIDSEFLHDLRVAVRRSRSVVGHGRHVLPADLGEWGANELKSIGTLTGPPRDLDVYVLEWDDYVGGLGADVVRALQPVRDQLESSRAAAYDDLAGMLRSDAVTRVLRQWQGRLAAPIDPALGGRDAARPLAAVVRRRIDKAQSRLLDHGRAITAATPAEEVHELRKDAKKLRYLLECFGGLLPDDDRTAFVKRLKALQDNLGEHQDAEVHVAELRQAVAELPTGTAPTTFVAVGQLIEQLDARRQAARDEFAERFTAYDSPKTHRALARLLDGMTA
ncbi:MAG: CHAD domain-containing protein [Ilumatobacteraceae bacterium]